MARVYDKTIVIQQMDEETEQWTNWNTLHAFINHTSADKQSSNAGATRATRHLTFEVRYFKALEQVGSCVQGFRVVYNDTLFTIQDFDDYQLKHQTVKLLCEAY